MQTTAHQWNPADYAVHSQGQQRWALELMDLLELQPGDTVLDLGCGDGRHTAEIARRVPDGRVLGIDRSAEMVAFAQEHFPSAEFGNLRFSQADASALPFVEEFSVVFSNAVLHWVKDHKPVLAGLYRSMRPGGRCVLQMGGKGNGTEVTRSIDRGLDDPRWGGGGHFVESPYGFHGDREYRRWVSEAGLVPESVELIAKDMVHADRKAFTGWLRTAWLPYVERVPENRREGFLEAVTDDYLEIRPPDDAGRVHVDMIRLQVVARKP